AFGLEQAVVDLFADRAQVVEGRQRLGRLEVLGVIDGRFRAKGTGWREKGEAHPQRRDCLVAFEAGGLLLGDADEDDALFSREAGALLGGDGVLVLAAAEMDDRHSVLVSEGVNGVSEAVEQWSVQGW